MMLGVVDQGRDCTGAMSINIRQAEIGDRDEWNRMRLQLFPDADPSEIDDWFAATDGAGTHDVGVAVLVADRGDGALAGFVEIGSRNYAEGCETTPVAYLEAWFVDPDARRSGVGRRLVEAAEIWASEHGYSEMASDTELANPISQAAHITLGYEEIERHVCYRKRLI